MTNYTSFIKYSTAYDGSMHIPKAFSDSTLAYKGHACDNAVNAFNRQRKMQGELSIDLFLDLNEPQFSLLLVPKYNFARTNEDSTHHYATRCLSKQPALSHDSRENL